MTQDRIEFSLVSWVGPGNSEYRLVDDQVEMIAEEGMRRRECFATPEAVSRNMKIENHQSERRSICAYLIEMVSIHEGSRFSSVTDCRSAQADQQVVAFPHLRNTEPRTDLSDRVPESGLSKGFDALNHFTIDGISGILVLNLKEEILPDAVRAKSGEDQAGRLDLLR